MPNPQEPRAARSESVLEKLKLLERAYAAQRYELVESLADSIKDSIAHVLVTMPHGGRPVHEFLVTQGGGRVTEGIREQLMRLPGVQSVVVDCTWNPPWSVARLTPAGRRAVGLPTG
jgi:hypothetical protein